MTTHLVIGDSHATPEVSNERYEWLGRFIVENQPDVIINMGDWFDFPSLCSYDKGKASFEGRRYQEDIRSGVEAQERFNAPIDQYNRSRSNGKRAKYIPRKLSLIGNHEIRIERAVEEDAVLKGTISLDDLQFRQHGWEVHRFLNPVNVDGIFYSHYFSSGRMGFPIAGEYIAANCLKKKFVSTTCAHSHILDFAVRTSISGNLLQGLVAGCWFEHNMDWTTPEVNSMYWRGICICHDVVDGRYDLEIISLDKIKKEYA